MCLTFVEVSHVSTDLFVDEDSFAKSLGDLYIYEHRNR